LTVALGADHRGFPFKTLFAARLAERGHNVMDFGTGDETSCDACDYAQAVVTDMGANPDHIGVVICGSGQAMAMTANRFAHIRAALCLNTTMARLAREHNDANVLVMGSHIIGQEVALDCLDTFLATKFLGGRYSARLEKMKIIGGL
jgi:ribose 5-phosphate isomerase B